MNCKWVASDQPRAIVGRHDDDCADNDTCRGCQPCTEPHCRLCARTHADNTCAECLAETRANLHEIAARYDALPDEVLNRGTIGEALMLLTPTANPEAWRQRRQYGYRDHRITRPDGTTERPDVIGEDHPLWVLGTWDLLITEHLGHSRRTSRVTMSNTVDYLDRNLSDLAADPDFGFDDFARELRACVTHLESVLHDAERGVVANVPCFECGRRLERRLGKDGFEDHWTCCGCKRRYTIAEYNFALRASLEEAPA